MNEWIKERERERGGKWFNLFDVNFPISIENNLEMVKISFVQNENEWRKNKMDGQLDQSFECLCTRNEERTKEWKWRWWWWWAYINIWKE